MKKYLSIAVHCLVILTCSATAIAESVRPKVGVILPLTGAFARYGEKIRQTIESLAKESPIDLVFENEGCDPAIAVRAYRRLSDVEGIDIFLGPWCGSPQKALAPLIGSRKQVAILPSSAPENVFDISKGRMLSVQHSIESESDENARFIWKKGYKSVVILFAENDFSRAHEAAFRKSYAGKVTDTLTYDPENASDIRALVTKIRVLKPEALYVPDAFPLMTNLNKELHAAGLGKLPVFSVYSMESDDVLQSMAGHGEGTMYSYPVTEGVEAGEFFAREAMKLLKTSLTSCVDGEPDCIVKSLKAAGTFDEHGVLRGKLVHKVVRDGKFVVEGS